MKYDLIFVNSGNIWKEHLYLLFQFFGTESICRDGVTSSQYLILEDLTKVPTFLFLASITSPSRPIHYSENILKLNKNRRSMEAKLHDIMLSYLLVVRDKTSDIRALLLKLIQIFFTKSTFDFWKKGIIYLLLEYSFNFWKTDIMSHGHTES